MNEATVGIFVATIALASFAAWGWILTRIAAGGPILPFAPRRNVPWQWPETAIIMLFVTLGAIVFVVERISSIAPRDVSTVGPDDVGVNVAFYVALVSIIAAMLFFARGARGRDFGWTAPSLSDLGIGAIGTLIALAPVYGLQLVLTEVLFHGESKSHPLLESLQKDPNPSLVAVVFISAVVVAPLAEEFLFRAFFQGWLERAFFRNQTVELVEAVMAPSPSRYDDSNGDDSNGDDSPVEATLALEEQNAFAPDDGPSDMANPCRSPQSNDAFPSPANDRRMVREPSLAAAAAPILVSSLIFSGVHVDSWPAPISLIPLALALGYVYHRTHRLWPCIFMHMFFNGLNVGLVLLTKGE